MAVVMPPLEDIKWAQRVISTHDDGKFGPGSITALIRFLQKHGFTDETPTNPGTPDARWASRARIVQWAEARIGELDPVTEIWPHVCPAFARPELRHTKSWCGGFALCAWKFSLPACGAWVWRDQVGFVGPYGVKTTDLPEPGDLRASRYAGSYWKPDGTYVAGSGATIWHYSVVRRVRGDGKLDTIDGNTLQGFNFKNGAQLEGVTERTVRHIEPGVTYYSAAAYL